MIALPLDLASMLGGSRQRGLCDLDNVIYQRSFSRSPFGGAGVAVVLTYENNGYLLWKPTQVREPSEDVWVWQRNTPTFLPPGREAALEEAVKLALALQTEAAAKIAEVHP